MYVYFYKNRKQLFSDIISVIIFNFQKSSRFIILLHFILELILLDFNFKVALKFLTEQREILRHIL